LAIEYVRDILDENAANSRPIGRRNSLKKNGQLKPLLGAGRLNLEPNVTKCLGIQNGIARLFKTRVALFSRFFQAFLKRSKSYKIAEMNEPLSSRKWI
jgi:hypothetical protein